MEMSSKMPILVLFVLAFFLVSGCAKKSIQTTPSGEEYVRGEVQKGEKAARGEGMETEEAIDEYQLRQEEKRRQAQLEQEREATEKLSQLEKMDMLKETIHFAFDSFELDSEARDVLKQKAKILKNYPEIKMVIEGHCDERGTEEYNLALGERRARAAYEFLILLGVDAGRLRIISYGEEKPVDPAHNETAWAKNRRDAFKIIK
jgi:peptidoglycan-associated lipoprotein